MFVTVWQISSCGTASQSVSYTRQFAMQPWHDPLRDKLWMKLHNIPSLQLVLQRKLVLQIAEDEQSSTSSHHTHTHTIFSAFSFPFQFLPRVAALIWTTLKVLTLSLQNMLREKYYKCNSSKQLVLQCFRQCCIATRRRKLPHVLNSAFSFHHARLHCKSVRPVPATNCSALS